MRDVVDAGTMRGGGGSCSCSWGGVDAVHDERRQWMLQRQAVVRFCLRDGLCVKSVGRIRGWMGGGTVVRLLRCGAFVSYPPLSRRGLCVESSQQDRGNAQIGSM